MLYLPRVICFLHIYILDATLKEKKREGREPAVTHKYNISDLDWQQLHTYFSDVLTTLDIKKNARRDSASSSRRRRFKTPTSLTLKTFLKKKVFYTLERFFIRNKNRFLRLLYKIKTAFSVGQVNGGFYYHHLINYTLGQSVPLYT